MQIIGHNIDGHVGYIPLLLLFSTLENCLEVAHF